jgi:mRNA interferase MazF
MTYKARQGDIIQLDFNPQKGFEQKGKRPAIVVSNNFFNKLSSLAIVCPISNVSSNFPLNVNLNDRTKTTGSILCQHVKSLDLTARNAEFTEPLPKKLLQEVLNIIHSEF